MPATPPAPPDQATQYVRFCREQVAYYAGKLAEWEKRLTVALEERGSRPGDGSDQPALFGTEAQTTLF